MAEFAYIPGYEGFYEIDRQGNIRKVAKTTGRRVYGFVKPFKRKSGYVAIRLTGADKKRRNYFVHQLVLLTYKPKPYDDLEPDHENRIRDDNRLDNLRWLTHTENVHNSSAYHGI